MITYFASPYTNPDQKIVEARYLAVQEATAFFMKAGFAIYSPIVHCHEIAKKFKLPTDWEFWWRYNQRFMASAKDIWILKLDGWAESKGVKAELEYANTHMKGVLYIEPDQLSRYV